MHIRPTIVTTLLALSVFAGDAAAQASGAAGQRAAAASRQRQRQRL